MFVVYRKLSIIPDVCQIHYMSDVSSVQMARCWSCVCSACSHTRVTAGWDPWMVFRAMLKFIVSERDKFLKTQQTNIKPMIGYYLRKFWYIGVLHVCELVFMISCHASRFCHNSPHIFATASFDHTCKAPGRDRECGPRSEVRIDYTYQSAFLGRARPA